MITCFIVLLGDLYQILGIQSPIYEPIDMIWESMRMMFTSFLFTLCCLKISENELINKICDYIRYILWPSFLYYTFGINTYPLSTAYKIIN